MNVVLGSAFRDSSGQRHLERYFTQAEVLKYYLEGAGHTLTLIAAEGDSHDDTKDRLEHFTSFCVPGQVVDVTHGKGWFGSTEEPNRFAALQGVGNGILQAVQETDDVLVYVESDLIWDGGTILSLIGWLSPEVDIVSPLIFAGEFFYDIFAYRAKGDRFSPFPPYHKVLEGKTLAEVDSVGSCLVMKAEVARKCRIPPEDGLVGFCRDAKSKGYRIWVDSVRKVRHP